MIQFPDSKKLTEKDLRDYFSAFNNNDFDRVSLYYAENLVFEGRGRHFQNRDEMLSFYKMLKSRIKETVTLREAIVGENEIAVEIETELVAFEDWPEMPTGPMYKGDRRRSQNFVWYEIANGQFSHIRSATYRQLEDGEPSAPAKPYDPSKELLPPAISEERFAAYIKAFNNDDYTAFGDFYDDDVILVIGGKKELRGRDGIFGFYKINKTQAKREIQINRVIISGNQLAAELQSEFVAAEDVPDFIAGPVKKGGKIFINTFVLYDLKDGKFSRIRSAVFRKIARPA
jgi:ketosteroid isomerase-like protein